MKIHEYQAKQLLREAGIAVPQGIVAATPAEAAAAFTQLGGPLAVVKAQIHAGGRGKGRFKEDSQLGGIQLVKTAEDARLYAEKMLGKTLVTSRPARKGARFATSSSKPAATSPANCISESSSTAVRGCPS